MVDQQARPATEKQEQNGTPMATDAAAAAAAASGVPTPNAGAPTEPATPTPQWSWDPPSESGSSRMKMLGGLGGAALIVVGVGGFIFARRRRRSSRREQAMQAARDSAMFAMATAGSLGLISRLRQALGRVIAGTSAMEQSAGKMAKHARKKLPR